MRTLAVALVALHLVVVLSTNHVGHILSCDLNLYKLVKVEVCGCVYLLRLNFNFIKFFR